jgi:hypothetical protein
MCTTHYYISSYLYVNIIKGYYTFSNYIKDLTAGKLVGISIYRQPKKKKSCSQTLSRIFLIILCSFSRRRFFARFDIVPVSSTTLRTAGASNWAGTRCLEHQFIGVHVAKVCPIVDHFTERGRDSSVKTCALNLQFLYGTRNSRIKRLLETVDEFDERNHDEIHCIGFVGSKLFDC